MKEQEERILHVLTGAELKRIITVSAQTLTQAKEHVNALNVFPVPDGDTGTNMALTLTAAVRGLDKVDSDEIGVVAASIARGSLMGARGNSGVILSQYFRGFSNGLAKLKQANGKQLAEAFEQASKTTYKAVMKPAEGTILTVGREIAEAATAAVAEDNLTITEVWEIVIKSGRKSLANTPNILPVLKQAGVVDAGGEGLMVILEGAYKALIGELDVTYEPVESKVDNGVVVADYDHPDHSGIQRIQGEIVNKYCTELFIYGKDLDIDVIRDALEPKGESLIVVGESEVIKIHIHTDRPGLVLDYASKHGDLADVKIDNMKLQNETLTDANAEVDFGSQPNNVIDFPTAPLGTERKQVGVVAVVPGKGLADIFLSLGVDKIIAGGQTMNPSTEELVHAVHEVNAESVIILPNNKNVIFSAEQVKELVEIPVEVIRTQTVPQGISSLMGYADNRDLAHNAEAMESSKKMVRSAEVTFAVRSTQAGEIQIEEQDIIGLAEGQIIAAGQSLTDVGLAVLENIVDDEVSIISLYVGNNLSMDEAEKFHALVQEKYEDCEVELYDGGQPLYYYIMSVE